MRIEVHKIRLTPYGEETYYRILLPEGYDSSGKQYPVLYLNDGQWVFGGQYSVADSFSNGDSLQYADYYSNHVSTLPQVIIVGIDSRAIGTKRTNAFAPATMRTLPRNDNGQAVTYRGTGNRYSAWIVKELKPFIDAHYRTKPGREWTAIGGFSSGASNALYTQLSYPDVFSRVLMLGSAVWLWDFWFEDFIARTASVSYIQFLFMLCGTDELTVVGDNEKWLSANRNIFDRLVAQGIRADQARFCEIKGGQHSIAHWRPYFPDSLRWVFQDLPPGA